MILGVGNPEEDTKLHHGLSFERRLIDHGMRKTICTM